MIDYEFLRSFSKSGFFYLASPYTSEDPKERANRAAQAHLYLGTLLSKNINAFSPIALTHNSAIIFSLPQEFEFWKTFNSLFIDASVGTVVCQIPDWHLSKGVASEVSETLAKGKPLFYLDIPNDYLGNTPLWRYSSF